MIIKIYNNYKSACMHKLDKLIQTKVYDALNRYRVYRRYHNTAEDFVQIQFPD